MDLILESLIVTFIALTILVCSVAIFVGYVIHKASELGGPGFLSTELKDGSFDSSISDDSRPAELAGAMLHDQFDPGPVPSDENVSHRQSRVEGPGGSPATLRSPTPCPFCARVRAALRNAWDRV
jgi:hypothetical protein